MLGSEPESVPPESAGRASAEGRSSPNLLPWTVGAGCVGGRAGGPLSAASTGQGVSAESGSTCGDREVTTQGFNTTQGDCRRQGRVMLMEVPPAVATCLCQGEWVPTSGALSATFSHTFSYLNCPATPRAKVLYHSHFKGEDSEID